MMNDLISRQAVINAIENTECELISAAWDEITDAVKELPPADPTIYGYNIKHLMLIAEILQKEGLSPDRVTEALTDIGKIVDIVQNEFVENLREIINK